ncbi:MAG: rod shape-determining protein MreC [Ardenticatenales bacterium]|jgi:rod shape-determining protein MreC|nr:rod shape-determining protein MreC [Ardenticatenales bacterium]
MSRRDRPSWMFALALLGVVFGLARGWRGPAVINGTLSRVLSPVTHALRSAREQVGVVTEWSRSSEALEAKVAELTEENARLQVESTKQGQLIRENEELRAALGYKRDRVDLDLLGASVRADVVGGEPGGLVHAIWIDQGSLAGVAAGDPVATHRGLVGRVVRTYGEASQVLLISDGGSAVGARVERSRATGMLVGSVGGELTLRYVPQNGPGMPPNIVVGDVIHTSGLDGTNGFPRMVPIGQVIEVRQSDERPNQEAVVRPFVDLGSVEFALVITGWRAVPLPDAAGSIDSGSAADGSAADGSAGDSSAADGSAPDGSAASGAVVRP